MNETKKILNRFTLIYYVFIFLGIISLIDILFIRFIRRPYYKKIQISLVTDAIPAKRGNIYDINDQLLATTITRYNLYWDSRTEYLTDERINKNIDSLAIGLANILKNKSAAQWKVDLLKARLKRNRNYKIATNVNYWQYIKIKKLPLFRKGRNRGGLKSEKIQDRQLLHGDLARRTIGFISSQKKFFGIEKIQNAVLSGVEGDGYFKKLGSNRKELLKIYKQPIDGDDIITTLDINMQDIVDKALRKQLKNLDAQSGVAILMDVKTGEIRAVANLSKVDNSYKEIKNLAATDLYEPGSVLKLASFMNAFEEDNTLNLNRKFNTANGIWQITKNFSIKDYNYIPGVRGGFGIIPVKRIFELSSNTGTAKMIHSIFGDKSDNFINRYSSYYFDKKLDLGFTNEALPRFSKPGTKAWSGVSIRQLALGYEILLSPYHIITLYNAVANNGKMMKPMFVKEIIKNGKVIEKFKPVVLNASICSKKTLGFLHTMLEGVVENGTGKRHVKSNLVKIAGKSGTAQILQKGRYKSDSTEYNTTFVAYFPADNPKYTCLVWISKPKKHKSGGAAAGPVVKEIAEKIYTFDYDLHKQNFIVNNMPRSKKIPFVAAGYAKPIVYNCNFLNIPFKNFHKNWIKPFVYNDTLMLKPLKIKKNTMPNLIGMDISDALYVLENMGLNVKFSGQGHVINQSIKPKSKISKNQNITLTLSI
jgi:cell division protein FtsI (penicillin-binding protein 3)